MQKILVTYLLVTGTGAFIALTMPGVVVLGFILLIIPGLLLSLAPTAFLWGCVFALSWWLCRTFLNDGHAAIAAVTITAAILIAIPWPSLHAGKRALEASVLPDITPAAPIEPSGDVRLDLLAPRWDNKNPPDEGNVRAFSCDNLCVALLFTPGVTSVTVNASDAFMSKEHREGTGGFARGARTYRLAPRTKCGDRQVDVDLDGRVGLFGKSLEENRAIAAEWNLKLATEYCVVAQPAIGPFDVTLRQGRYVYPDTDKKRVGQWSLEASPAQVDYVEIRDGSGGILLRRLTSRVSVLARPFWISASGGIENFRFGWGRKELPNAKRYAQTDLLKILEAHSTLAAASPRANLLPQIRRRLQQAVADPAPAPSDPIFETMEVFFGGIVAKPLSDGDLSLVSSLILDHRIISYPGLHHLHKAPADQHREIGAAIVLRLLATADVKALGRTGFSNFLAQSPKGAFSDLSEDERRLLASAEKRVGANGLVARLSDLGADAVPLLVEILHHHGAALNAALGSDEKASGRSVLIHAHSGTIEAARIALCRLGPAAAPALSQIEEMIADGVVPKYSLVGHGGTNWNLMLLRLGKPLDRIRKPESLSGSEAAYRRYIRKRIERFDPERSCS